MPSAPTATEHQEQAALIAMCAAGCGDAMTGLQAASWALLENRQ
jgi:hypothetical protein